MASSSLIRFFEPSPSLPCFMWKHSPIVICEGVEMLLIAVPQRALCFKLLGARINSWDQEALVFLLIHSAVDSPVLTDAGANAQHREWRTLPGHMQIVYTLQPESLTRRLMFVCSSLFHLNHIKMLFHTNWIFLSCHINLLHWLLAKTTWLAPGLWCRQMSNRRKPSDTVFFDFPFWFCITFLWRLCDSWGGGAETFS